MDERSLKAVAKALAGWVDACPTERADGCALAKGAGFPAGDALREIEYEDIPRAGRLLYATAALSLVLFGAVRFLLVM